MVEERDALYGAASPAELAQETYENYREYVNPPLARVMKLSGSPVEDARHGATIVDHNGKAYLDFAGGYGVFTLGYRTRASSRRCARSSTRWRSRDARCSTRCWGGSPNGSPS